MSLQGRTSAALAAWDEISAHALAALIGAAKAAQIIAATAATTALIAIIGTLVIGIALILIPALTATLSLAKPLFKGILTLTAAPSLVGRGRGP